MPISESTKAAPSNMPRKRSLILAGGGLKVAFQAGVMQVWLDEAKLKFDHADGASGGCFNLAMYCQGMSGKQIADNWRNLDPAAGVSLNWTQYARLFFAEIALHHGSLSHQGLHRWGLDWKKIRSSAAGATFNMYNFSKHQLEVVQPGQMDEDHLCAAVALPMFFPPVVLNGDTHIDAVYVTDANLEEAIRAGPMSYGSSGPSASAANGTTGSSTTISRSSKPPPTGRLRQIEDRIAANNDAISSGKSGEFGRPIVVKILQAEVALNYLVDFSTDRVAEAVNQGVQTAHEWCKQNGIPVHADARRGAAAGRCLGHNVASVHRRDERLPYPGRGRLRQGLSPRQGERHRCDGSLSRSRRTTSTGSSPIPSTSPRPPVISRATSSAASDTVEQGIFNLLVDNGDPDRKAMYYRLFFTDEKGNPLTLWASRTCRATTLGRLDRHHHALHPHLEGHVGPEADGGGQYPGGRHHSHPFPRLPEGADHLPRGRPDFRCIAQLRSSASDRSS